LEVNYQLSLSSTTKIIT